MKYKVKVTRDYDEDNGNMITTIKVNSNTKSVSNCLKKICFAESSGVGQYRNVPYRTLLYNGIINTIPLKARPHIHRASTRAPPHMSCIMLSTCFVEILPSQKPHSFHNAFVDQPVSNPERFVKFTCHCIHIWGRLTETKQKENNSEFLYP